MGRRDYDWQAELAARSAVADGRADGGRSAAVSASFRRVRPALWKLVRPLSLAVGLGVTIVGVGGHHLVGVLLIGLWICLTPLERAAARRRKREREQELEPTTEKRVQWELTSVAHGLRSFLGQPPDRATYERWLASATQQLERVSPEVARRWAQPDRGRGYARGTLSDVELESRRRRLLELYAEVAPSQDVEFLTSTLPQAPSARAITNS